ncbi:DUF2793 domain-containing protein [Paracoccaceae bacterium Fryx2]|nr:DUF2793 domain-containing protein [Paracoccaceae bacterium Fryx2]
MSDLSPVLALPFIMPAQAQKHVTHNEALRILDVLVQTVVQTRDLTVPPAGPQPGDRHIVAPGATGAWAGHDGDIAVFVTDHWEFLVPQPGWSAHVLAENSRATHAGSGWEVPADQPLRVAGLGVAATPDATNRLSVSSPATLLNHAGAGHQLKVNKAASGDTASLLYQTGFSGRAEMGTAGSDDFAIKVSADGAAWNTGLTVAAATGRVSLPLGALVADGTAAAPSLAFAASPGTGLWAPGAHQIGLSAGGVLRALLSSAALQIDLPVTGTAVQSGVTDATDGRLLRMVGGRGPFGLGSDYSPPITDFTAELRAGFWRFTENGVAGYPVNLPYFGGAFVARAGGAEAGAEGGHLVLAGRIAGASRATQRVHVGWRGTDAGAMTWTELFHQGNIVGTVTDSGGVPSGAVIESGTNANGSYTKWADGTMIATRIISGLGPVNTASGSCFISAGVNLGTLPAAFHAPPVRCLSAHTVSTNPCWYQGVSAPSATLGGFVTLVRAASYAGTDATVTATFIGRWKA